MGVTFLELGWDYWLWLDSGLERGFDYWLDFEWVSVREGLELRGLLEV